MVKLFKIHISSLINICLKKVIIVLQEQYQHILKVTFINLQCNIIEKLCIFPVLFKYSENGKPATYSFGVTSQRTW